MYAIKTEEKHTIYFTDINVTYFLMRPIGIDRIVKSDCWKQKMLGGED